MNRFKNKLMRNEYESAMSLFKSGSTILFAASGERRKSPNLGSGIATSFWNGYDGIKKEWDRDSKQTPAYAHYRAGQDAAKGASL